jgi:hypothetical protein
MEGNHSSSSDDSSDKSNATEWLDDNFDVMTVTILLLVTNIAAMANLNAEAKHTQMINDVVAPKQDYRHGGRRLKAEGFIV